jgi:Flp pilus assembly protein TadB
MPAEGGNSPISDLDAAIKSVERVTERGTQSLDERRQRQQDDDRSLLAKIIIIGFVAMVAVVIVAAGAGLVFFRDWNLLVEPGKFLMTILGSVMLPVVTLLIGYYFGNK